MCLCSLNDSVFGTNSALVLVWCRPHAARHVGFGVGAHTCPGSKLALAEAEACVHEVLLREPTLQRALPSAPVAWAALESMQTLVSLPLCSGDTRASVPSTRLKVD